MDTKKYKTDIFGFIKAKDGVFVPHYKEHWIVRKIIKCHQLGMTPHYIHQLLLEIGVKNRNGQSIARSTIYRVIKRANFEPHSSW